MDLQPTVDPNIFIEDQRVGYIRYRQLDPTTKRVTRSWEVYGTCDKRGDCLIGAVIDGVEVRNHKHLAEIEASKPGRVDSELDVPVTPEFSSCCGAKLFNYVELVLF